MKAAWAASERIGAQGLTFLALAILARSLSGPDMGLYFLCISAIALATEAGKMGGHHLVTRNIAAARARGNGQLVRATILRALVLSLLGLIACGMVLASPLGTWAFQHAADRNIPPLIPLIAGAVVVLRGVEVISAEALRGFSDIRGASLVGGLASRGIYAGAICGISVMGVALSIEGALSLLAISAVFSIGLGAALLRRNLSDIPLGAPVASGRIKTVSMPLLADGLLAYFFADAGVWLVGLVSGAHEVALFGAASRLAVLIGAPMLVAQAVIAPEVAQAHATGQISDVERILRRSANLFGVLALLLCLLYVASGPLLLSLLFGSDYAAAYPILAWLTSGYVVRVVSGSAILALVMTGYDRCVLYIASAGAVSAVTLASLGGWRFGPVGVAAGVAIGIAIKNALACIVVRRVVGVRSFMGGWRERGRQPVTGSN